MRSRRLPCVLGAASAVAAALSLVGAASATASTDPRPAEGTPDVGQHLAAAAYLTPTNPGWDQLAASGPGLGFVVVNVYNGPGTAVDPAWQSVIAKAHAAGVRVLGYVDTGYLGGSDPARYSRVGDTDPTSWVAQAEQDVSSWYSFYGSSIDGIFFDDVMNTCGPTSGSNAYANTYRFLSDTVHHAHPGSLTVLNPGISVPRCYEDAGDVLATFEGSAANYLDPPADLAPQPWQLAADPDTFWNIVYDVAPSQLAAVMAQSKRDNAGYVYATPDTLPNPYDSVPDADFWSAELAAAKPRKATAPATVRAAVALGTSASAVEVAWSSVGAPRDLAAYDVYENGVRVASVGRDEGSHGLFRTTVTGLAAGSSHTFQVRARTIGGAVSAPSRALHARTLPAWGPRPTTPGRVAITDLAAGSLRLSWKASTAVGGVTGYDVVQDGATVLTLPASVTSVHIGSLPLGAHVSYQVVAHGAGGTASAASDAVDADVPNPPAITDPAGDFGPTTTTLQAQFNVGFSFDHVFVDTDSSLATGYQFGGVGAEFMIENGILYRDADDSNTWNWSPVALDPGPLVSTTGGLHVWQVPSSVWGDTQELTVVFDGAGSYPELTLAPITVPRR